MKFRDRARVGKTALTAVAIAAAAAMAAGCEPKKSPPPGGGTVDPATLTEASIVVRDLSGDIDKDFAFKTVIGQILTSAGIENTPENQVKLVQTMLTSFKASGPLNNPVSGLPMAVTPRPNEAGLIAADLLDPTKPNGLVPIGLFNRMDLAPKDWRDCGEHRIVYATHDSSTFSRFLLIFEAKLPNPKPAEGMKGCLPVAQRWQAIGSDATKRKDLLKELYFNGLPGFEPVVSYLNYGGFLGQVRANLFMGPSPRPWQLREFRVLPVAAQTLVFSPAIVASNPMAEFYKDNPSGSAAEQAERTRFQAAFKAKYEAALRGFDAAAPQTMSADDFREGLLNCLGAPIEAADDEFQSVSQGAEDEPAALAGPTFKAGVTDWTSTDGKRTVTPDELLNRAGAVTCGGCHQFSTANKAIAGGANGAITWPGALPFVHISETLETGTNLHAISPALKDVFIPHRKKVLASILNGADPGALCPAPAVATTQKAAPTAKAAAAPVTRDDARAAAQQVLQAGPTASASAVNKSATVSAAARARDISDQAHAADQVAPGAVAPFRRPH